VVPSKNSTLQICLWDFELLFSNRETTDLFSVSLKLRVQIIRQK